jgi:hypothetical protein
MNGQKKFSFDKVTIGKIIKSCWIVLAGTLLSFISNNLTEILGSFSLSANAQVYLAGIFMILINAAREYIKGDNQTE